MDDPRLSTLLEDLTSPKVERHPPFRWQLRLLHLLLQGDLPGVLDLPTGLGKTTVMALWLVALAEGGSLPRRLVYVVDRRAVVDQATEFAERLRNNMPTALLEKLRLSKERGLPISTLRGGFADNRDWLEDPSTPAIIVGTIDMVGSRLLFEGYGVSRRMRPYHAGLLGADALVVLDEAHLCPPFEALLRQIAGQRSGELGPIDSNCQTPPFRLMSLSATGRDSVGPALGSRFVLKDEEREEPIVRQRLTATKRLKLIELTEPKSLTERIAERAVELSVGELAPRVLVYCHKRQDAVDVKRRIGKQCKHAESELLVGERRVYERTELAGWLERNGFLLGDADRQASEPTFLIATSAGEVGVDLDADHLVCDLVSYERLVQRLGRVNRRGGRDRTAMIDVFALRPEVKVGSTKAQRESAERALREFESHLAPLLHLDRDGDWRDASSSALIALKAKHPELVREATSRAPLYPALSRPLVDAWAMTSLKRHEGRPEVAPWLRGWEQDETPQSTVVWRKYLPVTEEGALPAPEVAAFFRAAPIHTTERLEADVSHVFEWLLKRAAKLTKDNSNSIDVSEIIVIVLDHDGELVESATMSLRGLRRLAASPRDLRGADRRERDRDKKTWKERLLPNNLLVVDYRVGGCRAGMLDDTVNDYTPSADDDERWRARLEDPTAEPPRPIIRFRVKAATGGEDGEGLELPEDEPDWRLVRAFETRIDDGGVAQRGLAVYKWHDDATDEDSRSILSTPQLLRDHADQVAQRAKAIAARLKLPDDEAKALALAGRWHDDGKAAPRWQRAMNAPDGQVYAKTKGGGNLRLLEGYRHEFGSLVMAEKALAQRGDLSADQRDLILHLISAHHGFSRPLISYDSCDEAPPSQLESVAGEAALRFARLQRKYGHWGLAWREAILRAADQAASREWSEKHRGG